MIPRNATPCYSPDDDERRELTALFESTDMLDHREAARLCGDCPVIDGCAWTAIREAKSPEGRWAGIPSGTWGGLLFKNGRLLTRPANPVTSSRATA